MSFPQVKQEIITGNPTPQTKTCDIRNIFQNSKLQLEIKIQTKNIEGKTLNEDGGLVRKWGRKC